MVHVVMRDGTVLTYSTGVHVTWDKDLLHIDTEDKKYMVAKIAADLVARVEGRPPCKVRKLGKAGWLSYAISTAIIINLKRK